MINRKPGYFTYALLGVVVLGSILRFTNLNWDSFLAFHPDERNIAWAVTRIRFFDQLNPQFFAYGGLPIYLYRALGQTVAFFSRDTAWINEWGRIVVVGRYVSATLSSLSILLIYFVATSYFSRVTGFLSAFLLAFSPWAIQQAHFATTETMLVFFLLVLAHFSARYSKTRTKVRYYILTLGITLGIALGAKTTSLLFTIIPLSSMCLSKKSFFSKLRSTIALFAIAAGTFLLFSPYTVIDQVHFLESMQYETGVVVGRFTVPYTLQFWGTTPYLYQLQTMLWQAGVVAILGFLGITILLLKTFLPVIPRIMNQESGIMNKFIIHNSQFIILWIFPLVYFAWSGSWFAKFSRYNVLVLPFFTIASAWFMVTVAKRFRVAGFACGALLLSSTVAWGIANWSIYLRPQTRVEASRWMYQNIPAGSLIYTEHWNDGLPVTVEGVQPVSFRRELLTSYDDPDNQKKLKYWVDKLSVGDFVIFTTPRITRTMPKLTKRYPVTSRVYQKLFSGELGYQEVATFTSYPQLFGIRVNDDAAEETIQVFDHPAVRIFQNIEKLSKEELMGRLVSSVGS